METRLSTVGDAGSRVPACANEELLTEASQPPAAQTPEAAARVHFARARQWSRAGKLNADLTGAETQGYCRPDRVGRRLIAQARSRMALSARGVHRVLRVARTIADLAGCAEIGTAHLAEAVQYRRILQAP